MKKYILPLLLIGVLVGCKQKDWTPDYDMQRELDSLKKHPIVIHDTIIIHDTIYTSRTIEVARYVYIGGN